MDGCVVGYWPGHGDGRSHRRDRAMEMALEYCGTGEIVCQLFRGTVELSYGTKFLVYVWLADTAGCLALKVFSEAVARGRDRHCDIGNHFGSV